MPAILKPESSNMPPTATETGSLISCNPEFRRGRPTIAGTGISVRSIVIDSGFGASPAEIAANRDLSLAQVFAALAYYHGNKQAVDDDIEAESRAYDEACAAATRL